MMCMCARVDAAMPTIAERAAKAQIVSQEECRAGGKSCAVEGERARAERIARRAALAQKRAIWARAPLCAAAGVGPRALRAALGPEAFDRAWLKARPLLGTPLADAIDEAGGIVEKAAAEDDAVDADAPPVPGEIKAVEKRMSMALKSRSRTEASAATSCSALHATIAQ